MGSQARSKERISKTIAGYPRGGGQVRKCRVTPLQPGQMSDGCPRATKNYTGKFITVLGVTPLYSGHQLVPRFRFCPQKEEASVVE